MTGSLTDVLHLFDGCEGKIIQFAIDGKVFRRGVFNGAQVDGVNLRFYIDDEKVNEPFYNLPYPFDVKQSRGVLYFDYRLDSLKTLKKTKPILNQLINKQKRRSKLLDNVLSITVLEP